MGPWHQGHGFCTYSLSIYIYIPWPDHPPLGVNVLCPGFSHWFLRLLRASSVIRKVKKTSSTSVSFVTGLPAHLSSGTMFSLSFGCCCPCGNLPCWWSHALPYFQKSFGLPDNFYNQTAPLQSPDTCPCFHLQYAYFLCLSLVGSSLLILCPLCLVSACWHGLLLSLEEINFKHPLAFLASSSLPWNSSRQISGQIFLSRSPGWSCCLPYVLF